MIMGRVGEEVVGEGTHPGPPLNGIGKLFKMLNSELNIVNKS